MFKFKWIWSFIYVCSRNLQWNYTFLNSNSASLTDDFIQVLYVLNKTNSKKNFIEFIVPQSNYKTTFKKKICMFCVCYSLGSE
jgi:hypothetical protein